MWQYFDFSPEVLESIKQKKPIIALESTLITHGLPQPYNLETAKECEEIARNLGVTPATIALMDGKIKIGLTDEELEKLINDKNSVKASTRDLAYILTKRLTGGTTVAATLFCANYAGIKIFATGGIDGVHRGDTQDISADLIELARTPIAVVCAGAKSILDVPRTLEYLETMSVPVIGYCTHVFPAFYTADSPYKLYAHVDNITTLAQIIKAHFKIKLPAGMLIANPIPKTDEIPNSMIDPMIEKALEIAKAQSIIGKDTTPFILNEVVKNTQGKCLPANISLIKNNVRVAAELALALG